MALAGFPSVSNDQMAMLIAPISEQETVKAIKGMNNVGAPRLDGVQVFFTEKCGMFLKRM
jgi:cbb3-type cytochrome oxidase cytochrome c subunit